MIKLIGAATGQGAQLPQCGEGPRYLQQTTLSSFLWEFVWPQGTLSKMEAIEAFNRQLAEKVMEQEFPIVIGGDHSIAVGTWNGVYAAEKEAPLGLIWIDAHMDSHTPETTPSNAVHGMPLAGLLGFGPPSLRALRGITPVLLPGNVCLVGVRSFEEEEAALLNRLGVRVFFMEEVKRKGVELVFQEAVSHVTKDTKRYGISLDLDVIDPKEAPGVGSPEEGGITKKDLLAALPKLCHHPQFSAFELVEYNPFQDVDNKTAAICSEVVSVVLENMRVYDASARGFD